MSTSDRALRECIGLLLVLAIASELNRRRLQCQKDFALEAVKTRCSAALFQLRQGRVKTATEFLRAMQADKLADMLGLRAEPQSEAA